MAGKSTDEEVARKESMPKRMSDLGGSTCLFSE